MSMAILVRMEDGKPIIVIGGSHAMVPLVYPVAEKARSNFPALHDAAFGPLEWGGDIDLGFLDSDQFGILYSLTCEEYQLFLEANPDSEKVSGKLAMWKEYLAALESDPRRTVSR
jgi:hypothetical protein